MSDPKTQLPDLSKTSFTTWKQKILGHCQMLGLKKYLTPGVAVTADQLETYEANQSKTAGILLSFMGTISYNRFVTEENEENPVELWKLLNDHYEAKTSGNHAKVYNDFITFQFKGVDLAAYLETVDEHLKIMLSVGMKFQGANCDVKESLIAENIVLKLPEKYSSTKEFLYSKTPLTIKLVKETLNNKRRDVSLNSVSVKTEDTAMQLKQMIPMMRALDRVAPGFVVLSKHSLQLEMRNYPTLTVVHPTTCSPTRISFFNTALEARRLKLQSKETDLCMFSPKQDQSSS
ncbi:hypothetical protein VP01_3745g1 [Puccinia sorghi]|uniref:Uncharacterized protein n=1 Tax=Puccinia sorghi TaxID=27349 RepID=A0A0L6UU10_9BASI|nr:hypothetical protein VP01_3745g1 [Puccinia sorghi]